MKRRLIFQIEIPADVTSGVSETQQEADDATGEIVLELLATALGTHKRFQNATCRYIDSAEPVT